MKRVLVIDDEVSLTTMIKRGLEKTGLYEVAVVNEAEAALAAAKRFGPDVVLLDVLMPGMNGGQVAAQISAEPELARVPIVFLTGIVDKAEAGPRGHTSGGRRVLAKPVSLAELREFLAAFFAGAPVG